MTGSSILGRAAVRRVGLLGLAACLLAGTRAQKIQTNSNNEGVYTTGNKLDLPDRLDLFSPPAFDIPMLLDSTLYESINTYQDYKNGWIVDISNIDPKVRTG